MRPYRDYLRARKPQHLSQMGPILPPVLDFLRESGERFRSGPVFGAACVKAEFLHKTPEGAEAALKVLQQPGAFDFQTTGAHPIPDEYKKCQVIADCMTGFIYTELSATVKSGAAANARAWQDTKASFAKTVDLFASFATGALKNDASFSSLCQLLDSVKTVVRAAQQEPHISPNTLEGAITFIKDAPEGARLSEGFKHGVGAALMKDAKLLLVSGELDAQREEQFLKGAQNILGAGLELQDDGCTWMVPADLRAAQSSAPDMITLLSEGVSNMAEVMAQWSAKHMLNEADSLRELLEHMARHLSIYDAGNMPRCIESLGHHRTEWAIALKALDDTRCPPPPTPRARSRRHRVPHRR